MALKKENIKYREAIGEAQEIISQIESGEMDIDDLAKNVKRVTELLDLCKQKLKNADKEITELFSKIDLDKDIE